MSALCHKGLDLIRERIMLDNFFSKLPITVAFRVKSFYSFAVFSRCCVFHLTIWQNSHNGGEEGREEKFQIPAKSIKSNSWQGKIKIVGGWLNYEMMCKIEDSGIKKKKKRNNKLAFSMKLMRKIK